MATTAADLWIFAYGSLMWRPDFPFVERVRADLDGYHRSLCIESHLYRGTAERPGLVFGLDHGGRCEGVAYGIAPALAAEVLAAVRARELVLGVYREECLPVRLADGRLVSAVSYVADPEHSAYAGRLPARQALAMVRDRAGASGTNRDYVLNTHGHLAELGIRDPMLDRFVAALVAPPDGLTSMQALPEP